MLIWAISSGVRVRAWPGERAFCPCCNCVLVAKCGSIVSWHWAHMTKDCDPWYEPESEWHIHWKQKFPDKWQEVVIGSHRADLRTPTTVIELQASSAHQNAGAPPADSKR